jgi:hypothetical protein
MMESSVSSVSSVPPDLEPITKTIRKRDGVTVQSFDVEKIRRAVSKAWLSEYPEINSAVVERVIRLVVTSIENVEVTVEDVQDLVELALMKIAPKVAKHYILYREERAKKRALVSRKPDPKAVSGYIHAGKYAKHRADLGRREVYAETVDRDKDMHVRKFPHLRDQIEEAFGYVHRQQVLPSMRSFQFAGLAIEKVNARQYNCSFTHIDRFEAFSQGLYLLLCGCGVGYSVQYEHVEKLPPIGRIDEKKFQHHVIADTIEGWGDAVTALFQGFQDGVYVEFSYHLIRPAGSPLKTSGGRAPGHAQLKKSLEAVRGVLLGAQGRQLRPIEAHRIMCMLADAPLSGGIRRSAMIALFSPDDSEMRDCKTGDWFSKEGYFKNANNSAVYLRNEASKKLFMRNMEATKAWGDPGFYFTWDLDYGANPCVPAGTRILTRDGYVPIESLVDKKSMVWNGIEWCAVAPRVTGRNQPMVRVSLSDGTSLDCTDYHEWCIATGKWSRDHIEERVKAKDLEAGDVLMRYDMPVVEGGKPMEYAYTHGFYCADGCLEDAGRKSAQLYGVKQALVKYLNCERVGDVQIDLDRTRVVFPLGMPDKFAVPMNASVRSRLDWFAGVLDGDGSVVQNPKSVGLQLGSINLQFLRDVRLMLTTLGVQGKIALAREEGMTVLPDGRGGEKEYLTQDFYRLLINATDTYRLVTLGLKTHRLDLTMAKEKPQRDARRFVTVTSVERLPRAETVYCFTEEKNHTGTFEGIVTGQCVEIGLHPILIVDDVIQARLAKKGIQVEIGSRHAGFAFCNLTTINAAKFKSADDFMAAARAATFIGTLQASYTNFPYLGWVSEAIAERDALLGVSMTGMLDAPEISCNPTLQRSVARRVKEWNREFAELLGIEPAARTTCVKPEGTASLEVGGVATGQHGHHARRYFKRVIANEHEFIFQEFKKVNPHMCVRKPDGEWVIEFPVEAPAGAILKGDLGAIEFLRMGLSTQKNWVVPGLADDRYSPRLHHNVSITVQVKPDEWGPVAEFIWTNREYFTGVSLFAATGDKDFAFAPNEEVVTGSDEARWADLVGSYVPVDYASLKEENDTTDLKGEIACSGGQCEVNI